MMLKIVSMNLKKISPTFSLIILQGFFITNIIITSGADMGIIALAGACILIVSVRIINLLVCDDFGGEQTAVMMTIPASAGETVLGKGIAFAIYISAIPMVCAGTTITAAMIWGEEQLLPLAENMVKGMIEAGVSQTGVAILGGLIMPEICLISAMAAFMAMDGVLAAAGARETNTKFRKIIIITLTIAGSVGCDIGLKILIYGLGSQNLIFFWILLVLEQGLIALTTLYFYRDCKNRLETKADLG